MAVTNATTNSNLGVGEGHCSVDSDCAPGLKCFPTPNSNPPGVTGVPAATAGKPGAKVCYQPDTQSWNVHLVVGPEACALFAADFPCVGTNMLTGPHSNDCLNDMWKKSGCTGDVKTRLETIKEKGAEWLAQWQSNAYTIDQMVCIINVMNNTD